MRAIALLFGYCCMSTASYAGGDREYGQYLSSECVTCHQSAGAGSQIPVINGMHADGFIDMMKLYRSRQLENQTMQTVARRLSDEDISALAAYFSALKPPD